MGTCNCYNPQNGGCSACNDGLSTPLLDRLHPYTYPIKKTDWAQSPVTYSHVPTPVDADRELREAEIDTAKAVLLLAHRYRHKTYVYEDDKAAAARCEAFAKKLLGLGR